ncbi:hypothetical protein HPP92_024638 [Vanilla planifolia]|uniref:Scarecrow-like protein 32 n=1 Tax=Vanilla planifolia TaxID=51239 RepID=A0A835UD61_VANPL|nr:hypothetical protein HPP92_026570 [Vanilla planifolia]KAG0456850.1 hypothetical protein HPP92_024638 [Vanilla planifolia]
MSAQRENKREGDGYDMLQFTESSPLPPLTSQLNNGLLRSRAPWPDFPSSSSAKQGHLGSINSAACMEQLLAHCAYAIESNDATLAQQILWVLHNIAPPDGDSNQRLTAAFLRALVLRASSSGSSSPSFAALASTISSSSTASPTPSPLLSPVSLAAFVDLTPWHRFGFTAANSAIADATDGFPVVHIVDLTTTHCMQLPTLIDTIAARRPDDPPFIRLTVPTPYQNSPPPSLDISLDELGSRLVTFARSRNIKMDFRVVPSSPADGFNSLFQHLRIQQLVAAEALVVNCHMIPHYIPDEDTSASCCGLPPRTAFLKALRSLDPIAVVVVDEDADFTAGDVVTRLRAAFNYLWIPFDTVDTFLPRGSEQRRRFEAAVFWKIENTIACEGVQRVERLEPRSRWVQRLRAAGFRAVGFSEDTAVEVKTMLDEHSAGWGMKRDDESMVLTWKGHDVVFASAWIPSSVS